MNGIAQIDPWFETAFIMIVPKDGLLMVRDALCAPHHEDAGTRRSLILRRAGGPSRRMV
jgi:hypothetical protein